MTQPQGTVKPPHRALVGVVLAVSALLYASLLEEAGFGDPYYAAAVRSMTLSWRHFFYASVDPLGFVSADRLPLGLWIQALFARIFGFGPSALRLPQALSAVGSCYVLYRLIRLNAGDDGLGRWCGLLGAIVLAVTPVFAASARSAATDMPLLLLLLLAAWAFSAAAVRGGGAWITALGAFSIGLGFHIGSLRALWTLPAMAAVYLIRIPDPDSPAEPRLARRAVCLACALAVLVATGAAWMTSVTLTDEAERPWIGGSGNNSAFALISWDTGPSEDEAFAEEPGADRFFGPVWGGQIAWMMVPAALGGILSLVVAIIHRRSGVFRGAVMWLVWLAAVWAALSFSRESPRTGLLVMAAPAVAGCCGLGLQACVALYRKERFYPLISCAALVVSAFWQLKWITRNMQGWNEWLVFAPLAALGCALTLALLRYAPDGIFRPARSWTAALALIALLTPAAVWAGTPLAYGDAHEPIAGPMLRERPPESGADPLLGYLVENRGKCEAIAIVGSGERGARMMLMSGEAVIIAGGRDGSDRYLTLETLTLLVEQGRVRYMVVDAAMRQPQLLAWANTRLEIPAREWLGHAPGTGNLPRLIDLSRPNAEDLSDGRK
ncbi:MAG: hypothetical protein GX549_01910 [Clostridiales bacterium]|nr:hypothetical protein [Clostridiales bacterium]